MIFLDFILNNYNYKIQKNESRIQYFLKIFIKWNNIIMEMKKC